MKIKTITADYAEELDNKVNTFEEEHTVHFTQTHVTNTNNGLYYTAIVFWSKKKDKVV